MHYWPAERQALRLLHLHLNTLGFIGLTAIGTLQVLLPTILSGPDTDAATRLRRDLPVAVAGVLLVGLGAAFCLPLSVVGTGFLFYIACRPGLAWLSRYGLRKSSPMVRLQGWRRHCVVSCCSWPLVLPMPSGCLKGVMRYRPSWRLSSCRW